MRWSQTIVAIAMLGLGTASCSDSDVPRSAPVKGANLVVFVADDLGWGDVGFHGSEIRTPRLDRLAAGGLELDRCYAFPLCSPSRAALLTGRSPFRYGMVYEAVRVFSEEGLPLEEPLLVDRFRDAGYFTALVGKWHLGHGSKAQFPHERGFDHFYGCVQGAIHSFEKARLGSPDWQRNGRSLSERGYSTHLIANEAKRLIGEQVAAGRPFFLMVSFNAPHTPLGAPQETIDSYASIDDPDRRTYAAMVTEMDRAIGAVVDQLEQLGQRERTLVVFLSDNGANEAGGGNNGELAGGKRSLTEGGIRVPAVASWPGQLPSGAHSGQVLGLVDLLPTAAAALGVSLDGPKPLDGRDYWSELVASETSDRQTLVFGSEHSERTWHAAIDGNWKLLIEREKSTGRDSEFLYDLDRDPAEVKNLAAQQPARVKALRREIEEWKSLYPAGGLRAWDGKWPAGWEFPDDFATPR